MNPKWFVRGDIDGFVGLFIDNLLQLLLIAVLCPVVCGLPNDLIIGRILPAAALSIVFGNLYYSWQAWRLAKRSGRSDVTALPYGINTVSLVAYIFLIMGPIWQQTQNATLVWQAGVFACVIGGVFELIGAFVTDPLRRFLPRAALLSTLAGVAITFIAMGFVFQIFASPVIAVAPMLLIVVAYASGLRMPFGIPAGFAAILLGTAIAWIARWIGIPLFTPSTDPIALGLHLPAPDISGFLDFIGKQNGWQYFSVILPMALFNIIGSLQNLESAEAAGDRYETRPSLVVNGLGSIVAGLFGSAFPTTIYIGHPGWKAMGARIGYSAVNGVVICILAFLGVVNVVLRFVPIEATLGILLWIGLVITAQAFRDTPRNHALAVAIGLIPALAAWALLLIETSLRAANSSLFAALPNFGNGLFINGVIALNQGFLFTSMLLAAVMAFVIDGRFKAAAVCCFLCAALSLTGLIHGYALTELGLETKLGWFVAPQFALAYAIAGALFLGFAFSRRAAPAGV
jgi:AGZA family xanthine/uracil permease-like MFS transporter